MLMGSLGGKLRICGVSTRKAINISFRVAFVMVNDFTSSSERCMNWCVFSLCFTFTRRFLKVLPAYIVWKRFVILIILFTTGVHQMLLFTDEKSGLKALSAEGAAANASSAELISVSPLVPSKPSFIAADARREQAGFSVLFVLLKAHCWVLHMGLLFVLFTARTTIDELDCSIPFH